MADTVRRVSLLGVGVIAVAALLGWRALGDSAPARTRDSLSGARAELAGLMPYTLPLADSSVALPEPGDVVTARRDPFAGQPLTVVADVGAPRDTAAAPRATAALHVTATLLAGSRRAAVINDSLVYVGQPIPGGGTLKSVERDHVTVIDLRGAARTVAVDQGVS